jgi:hypothetical protein
MLKKAVQRGRRRIETGRRNIPTRPTPLSKQLFSQAGYVEDFDEPRTKLADFFSILSVQEKMKRKDHL